MLFIHLVEITETALNAACDAIYSPQPTDSLSDLTEILGRGDTNVLRTVYFNGYSELQVSTKECTDVSILLLLWVIKTLSTLKENMHQTPTTKQCFQQKQVASLSTVQNLEANSIQSQTIGVALSYNYLLPDHYA